MYVTQEFNVHLRWMEESAPAAAVPIPARAEVEVSQLLPQALMRIRAFPPEEWGFDEVVYVIRISPQFHEPGGDRQWLFEVWVSLEDQGWITGEFDWDDLSIDYDRITGDSDPLDELSDALSLRDENGVFEAFSRLRGGQLEFVNWIDS